MTTGALISTLQVRTLVEAGAIQYAAVRGTQGGYVLVVKVGMTEKTLSMTQERRPRVFVTLDGLASVAQRYGFRRLDLDLAGHAPKGLF
jgi:hypothetical protein